MGCKDCGRSQVDHPVLGLCRPCNKKRDYIKHKDKNLATKRKYYERIKDSYNAKRREGRPARKTPEKEHKFTERGRYLELQRKTKKHSEYSDIGFELYKELIANPCYYCEGPLAKTGIGLDKKDPDRWYLLDNVVPCCAECNRVKNNILTFEEMRVAMKAVIAFRRTK